MGQSGKDNTLRLRREAELVVRQLGRPVPLGELYRQLIKRGMDVEGTRPLGWKLTHATNLVFIRKRGWWLKSVPLPTSTGSNEAPREHVLGDLDEERAELDQTLNRNEHRNVVAGSTEKSHEPQ